MFEFKGAAAGDAINNRQERDWRVVDHYNIQHLGKQPFNTMQPSPTTMHQRSWTEDTRLPSLLQLRSRSNSSLASQSRYESYLPSPPTLYPRTTSRASIDERSSSSGSTHKRTGSTDSFGRTLMAKGTKLLRRQNSKHDLTSLQTFEWSQESKQNGYIQDMSSRPGSRQSRAHSSSDGRQDLSAATLGIQLTRTTEMSPRYNISEPFNFQHLTHTTSQHVQKIQSKTHNDLVSEFSAIRASQAPRRELRGIKANDIQHGTSLSEASVSLSASSSPPRTSHADSPPRTPFCVEVRKMSRSRSIENFSQPTPGYHTAQVSPITPPPRKSSRSFTNDFFSFHEESTNDPSEDLAKALEERKPLGHPAASWDDAALDFSIPHAVTTPDDSAHPIRPPPFSLIRTELAGVPEEDETSEGKRSSIATSIVRPSTPTSSLRHAKSFPSIKSLQRRSGPSTQVVEEDEQWLPRQSVKSVSFVAPHPEEHQEEIPVRPRASRRISIRKEDSWEEVIDYCYEHEAEADCNFDWDVVSIHEEHSPHAKSCSEIIGLARTGYEPPVDGAADASFSPDSSMTLHRRSSSRYPSPPPSLLPLQTSLPDLQHSTTTSAESSFSSIPESATPLQFTLPGYATRTSDPNRKGWSTNISPVVLPDESISESPFDNMYREMLTAHDVSDQQLSFHPARVDGSTISNSPRSSRSPISKSSSQESFWFSQANAAARRQRNAGSVGSLPELVQSRSNERSEVSCEQIGEHTALLNINDAPAEPAPRRCSPNLAKDIALKTILSKIPPPEEREPLPIHPAFRDRAHSDATSLSSEYSTCAPQAKSIARKRSTSSASSLSSRTGRRASYSLFPPPPTNKIS